MKTLPLLAALPLLLVVVAPLHADAVDEAYECRGLTATVVGAPGGRLEGTEGADVIVTNGAESVDARGGDDTICVTGAAHASIGAGSGDDLVDAGGQPASLTVSAYLAGGDDTYLGHEGSDLVSAGGGQHSAETGAGSDTVSTGGGPDTVETGTHGHPNTDTVDVGDGDDTLKMFGTAEGSLSLAGGPGRDQVRWPRSAGPRQWTFDNRQGLVRRGDVEVAHLTGLEAIDLRSLGDHDVTFLGSDAAEAVRVTTYYGAPTGRVTASLGGGNDWLWVSAAQELHLDGGSGRDGLDFRVSGHGNIAVTMDLRAGTVATEDGTVIGRYESFENAILATPRTERPSRLIGTPGDNVLQSCHGRIDGLGGDDRLLTVSGLRSCNNAGAWAVQLYGGPGDDRLFGGRFRDRLVAGPGRDTANGGPASDLCRGAERRTSCER